LEIPGRYSALDVTCPGVLCLFVQELGGSFGPGELGISMAKLRIDDIEPAASSELTDTKTP